MNERQTTLTPDQLQAVTHPTGPCLVVAGAGTGKTRVITERIAHLIESGVEPSQILALTFAEKAAGEMQERLDVILEYGVFGTTISTFHGFANELIRRHAFRLGINPDARLITEADQVAILREHLAKLPLKKYIAPYNPMPFLKKLASYVEDAKEARITAANLKEHASALCANAMDEAEAESAEEYLELAECMAVVENLYKELDVLTYADLLRLAHELLTTSAVARTEEQERYTHLLIDEFQDTNVLQAEIAYALAGHQANIFVVGDDDQSIYRFRGANIANILTFRERFPEAAVITLTENYRSTQPILDAAYNLIQKNNPHRLEVALKLNKRLRANVPGDTPPEHLWFSTGTHEAEGVATRIHTLLSEGYAPADIAVLARSHNHLDAIEDELSLLQVPTTRSKEGNFYEEPSIIQALAYLRFLAHPNHSENVFRLLTGAPFDLSGEELAPLNVQARKGYRSLWQQLKEQATHSEALTQAITYLQEALTHNAARTPAEALRDHVYKSKWQNTLFIAEEETAARHLMALHTQAKTYALLHRPATISGFVEQSDRLALSGNDVSVESELQAPGDGVRLMTVHASKGLEFPVVFIVNMVMKRFPGMDRVTGFRLPASLAQQLTDSVPHEEERRLAYVALTRAKERLFLSGAAHYGSNKQKSQPSVFITEAMPATQEPALADGPLRGGLLVKPAGSTERGQLEMPRHLSASALEAFEDNPAEFYKQHILQIIPEDETAIAFGTCIHSVLRDAFLARMHNQEFDLEKAYERCFDGDGYSTEAIRDKQRADGLAMLHEYLNNPEHMVPELIEEPIVYQLPDMFRVIGKVDRIDRLPDGSLRIVDYKTGNKEAKTATVKQNLPLAIYALALVQKGETVSQVGLSYLKTGSEHFITVDDTFLTTSSARVTELIEKIRIAYKERHFPDSGLRYS